jgi:hypothetical protein
MVGETTPIEAELSSAARCARMVTGQPGRM